MRLAVIACTAAVALLGCVADDGPESIDPIECDTCDGSYDSYEPNNSWNDAAELGPIGIAPPVVATLEKADDEDWFETINLSTDEAISYRASLSTAYKPYVNLRVCLFFDEETESVLLPAERLSCVGERVVDEGTGMVGCCGTEWEHDGDRFRLLAIGTYIGESKIASQFARVDRVGELAENAVYLLELSWLRP